MPNTPASSFIPKQGPAKRSRQVVSRQVHIFTILSYILFFGSLVAAAGVFLYDRHINNQLRDEVAALDAAISNFSNEKMGQVKAFNTRLEYAQNRISNSVSAVSIFRSLEDSTAQAAAIQSLKLTRIEDQKFLIEANINTDTFDSALFQRGLYERNSVIESVAFEDVGLGRAEDDAEVPVGVSFKAELSVPLSAVPYTPDGSPLPVTDMTVIDLSTTTNSVETTTTGLDTNNE